jgi:hypothetical protein
LRSPAAAGSAARAEHATQERTRLSEPAILCGAANEDFMIIRLIGHGNLPGPVLMNNERMNYTK